MAYKNANGLGSSATARILERRPARPNGFTEITQGRFDLWWEQTFYRHSEVIAKATAIMAAHHLVRNADSADH
jgi:hypothetical protein